MYFCKIQNVVTHKDVHGRTIRYFPDSDPWFRVLKRVRPDSYFVLNYMWLYQKWNNWNPFQYDITDSKVNDGSVQSCEDFMSPSNEKTTQSKLALTKMACQNFQKY